MSGVTAPAQLAAIQPQPLETLVEEAVAASKRAKKAVGAQDLVAARAATARLDNAEERSEDWIEILRAEEAASEAAYDAQEAAYEAFLSDGEEQAAAAWVSDDEEFDPTWLRDSP
jgi:hypothetical protein